MKKSTTALAKGILLCLSLILMLTHPGYVTEGAKKGLLLWYSSVVPALFPFMVLSGAIVASGGIRVLTAPFYFFLHPLFKLSEPGCYVLISGLLCGYPMGAKTCADFIREGRLPVSEGRRLMAVCNQPSPMFLLGFAYPLIKGVAPLFVLLLAVYAPLPLLFALSGLRSQKKEESPAFSGREKNERKKSTSDLVAKEAPVKAMSLDETIMNAFEVLCKIAGYLILFSIVIVFLLHAKAIPAFFRLLLIGAMEMTTGIKTVTALLPAPFAGAAACAALTFGGFSGLFQTKAVIDCPCPSQKKAGLSIRQYFLWKVLHGTCSFFLFLCLTM